MSSETNPIVAQIAPITYETRHGSTVKLSGKHRGIAECSFDWLTEPEACFDCVPDPYPVDWGDGELRLQWSCDYCGGGSATLFPRSIVSSIDDPPFGSDEVAG